jgi:ketosteroid isomerase-like protein
MTTREILQEFYSSFANGDSEGMTVFYTDETVFSDPAFGTLKGNRARAMWQMLLERSGGDLKVYPEILEAEEASGKVYWRAEYHFGPEERHVINHVNSSLTIKEGKILRHADDFSFWQWSRQALGLPGLLLGWTPFLRNKVQQRTNKMLDSYIKKQEPHA